MIRYFYVEPEILFVGINPHFGSFARGVPFSNNKSFWYLLSEAGVIEEKRAALKDDVLLKRLYTKKFNRVYKLGFINIISRPTRGISELTRGEELPGRKKISTIIKLQKPKVVCFIGKIPYEKYSDSKEFSYGWQESIWGAKVFVMHSPLRGEAKVRIQELRMVKAAI
ncbi:MAG: mismatch-specific DNA-glycosylase [Bacteroidia bacterium]|jgi:TDG/mug DNA glycosylase family protein